MKNKIYKFDLNIYPRTLWVAITKDICETELYGVCPWTEDSEAITCEAEDKEGNLGFFIRFGSKSAMTVQNIAHESAHAAMFICDSIGGNVDLHNQEYFSYLTGFIAKCCDDVKNMKHESKQ